jgi:hypothetical protein
LKLRWWGDKPEPPEHNPDESDAMKGNYAYADLIERKKQEMTTALTGPILPVKGTDGKVTMVEQPEENIDTLLRARSVITNGSGSLGADFPIGREAAIADFQLTKITRWATNNLKPTNALRRFMEADLKDNFHLDVDRSIERDQPLVVMSYKPMIWPGAPDPMNENAEARRTAEQKKP